MWDPKFYTTLSIVDMMHIFQGDDDIIIPRISQRLTILHEVGKVLLDHYDGINHYMKYFMYIFSYFYIYIFTYTNLYTYFRSFNIYIYI